MTHPYYMSNVKQEELEYWWRLVQIGDTIKFTNFIMPYERHGGIPSEMIRTVVEKTDENIGMVGDGFDLKKLDKPSYLTRKFLVGAEFGKPYDVNFSIHDKTLACRNDFVKMEYEIIFPDLEKVKA